LPFRSSARRNVFRYISNNEVGIVERCGRPRLDQARFIALQAKAGFQPEIVRGGIHVSFLHLSHPQIDLVTVGAGQIAYVFARDGAPLAPSQVSLE